MHKRLLLGLVLFAVGAFLPLRAQTPAAPAAPAPMPAGQIIAAKVTGVVTMTVNASAAVRLQGGEAIPQHATIDTQEAANIVLVFSNGATTQLGERSQLVIDEFLQDPFAAALLKIADLDAEPTTSKTKLRLNHGELVGNVKHLQHTKGSTFTVETPVGAAGIRGTTFRIVFRPNGTGLAFFSLSTVEGNVAFQQPGAPGTGTGTTPAGGTDPNAPATGTPATGTATPAGTGTGTPGAGTTTGTGNSGTGGLAVTGGQEVVITINVTTNPTTGVVTATAPVVVTNTTNITAATLQAVSQQVVAIATTAAAVTFTSTPQPPAPTTTPASGTTTGDTTTPTTGTTTTTTPDPATTTTGTTTPTPTPTPTTTTNTNPTTTNPPSNLGSTPPPATSSTPRVTSGDGKSD